MSMKCDAVRQRGLVRRSSTNLESDDREYGPVEAVLYATARRLCSVAARSPNGD